MQKEYKTIAEMVRAAVFTALVVEGQIDPKQVARCVSDLAKITDPDQLAGLDFLVALERAMVQAASADETMERARKLGMPVCLRSLLRWRLELDAEQENERPAR